MQRLKAVLPEVWKLMRPRRVKTFEPRKDRAAAHAERHRRWQSLYPPLSALAAEARP